jgi:hypothetical protein
MSAKGNFPYLSDTMMASTSATGCKSVWRPSTPTLPAVTVTDMNGNQQPIPAHITLADSAGTVAPWNNAFLITWIENYTLSVDGAEVIWMTRKKQQAFKTAVGVTHFTV